MSLIQLDRLPVRQIFPGLRARLVHSDRVTHSWVDVDAGATFPEHQHPHEQIVNVLEGELELVVDGGDAPVDAWNGVRDSAECEAFRPRRHGVQSPRRFRADP